MATKHVHKYHKVDSAGVKLFFCALPDCSHHMPKHYERGLIGKLSICWSCDNEFILDERAMSMEMPVCINCASNITDEMVESFALPNEDK